MFATEQQVTYTELAKDVSEAKGGTPDMTSVLIGNKTVFHGWWVVQNRGQTHVL